MGEFIGLVAVILIFGPGIFVIWSKHHQRMMELKLQMGEKAGGNVAEELKAIRQEMAELRDTATRYDLSFDAALQRLESRMGNVEGRVKSIEQDHTRAITS